MQVPGRQLNASLWLQEMFSAHLQRVYIRKEGKGGRKLANEKSCRRGWQPNVQGRLQVCPFGLLNTVTSSVERRCCRAGPQKVSLLLLLQAIRQTESKDC